MTAWFRPRLLLFLATLACILLFWFAGRAFNIPAFPGHNASLLAQPDLAGAFAVTSVVTLTAVLIGTLIAGTVRFDAGFFAASIGLTVLSIRGGPMRQTLFAAESESIYLLLLCELLLLYAVIGLGWAVLWLLHRREWLQPDSFRDGVEDVDDPLDQKLLALSTHIAVMVAMMVLLSRTDAKPQVLAAVGIAAFIGAITSHYLFPVRPSVWYWAGPLVVGAIGYAFAFYTPGAWMIGRVPQPLARPLPLDYASAGPAGAVLGYWFARRWQRLREAAQDTERPSVQSRS